MHRLAAAVGQQAEASRNPPVVRKEKFAEHVRGYADRFLGIHEAPYVGGVQRAVGRQRAGKAVGALIERLLGTGRQQQALGLQPVVIGALILGQAAEEGVQLVRVVVHCQQHVLHPHQVDEMLGEYCGQAAHRETHREDIAEGILRQLQPLLRVVPVEAPGRLAQPGQIGGQVVDDRVKMAADGTSLRVPREMGLHRCREGLKIGAPEKREIAGHHVVVAEQLAGSSRR